MKWRTLMLAGAVALAIASGVAQADDQKPMAYHYGMPLNISKVIAMNETQTNECKVIDANIRFLNKAGKVEDVVYRKLSDACSFQN
ncbi:DUF2790 domain-containing protein [Pseudomonas fildesensis]|uniref:DUF2790 domain-containing protein n=1 Tax=Pseudomonas fildesensis TaxID=1674920 RepID=UPI00387B72C3